MLMGVSATDDRCLLQANRLSALHRYQSVPLIHPLPAYWLVLQVFRWKRSAHLAPSILSSHTHHKSPPSQLPMQVKVPLASVRRAPESSQSGERMTHTAFLELSKVLRVEKGILG